MGQLAGVAQITASLPTSEAIAPSKAAGGAHDGALLVQSEALVAEALERRLENPRLKRHAGCFAEGIELLRYPERLYCGIDASWRDNDLLDREGHPDLSPFGPLLSAASASLPAATSSARL